MFGSGGGRALDWARSRRRPETGYGAATAAAEQGIR